MKAGTKKTSVILFIMTFVVISTHAQQLKAPGVKWEESYKFDKCNNFKIEFYAKGNDLRRTGLFKTYYQSDGENFVVKSVTEGKGNGMETVIDKKNEVAIQLFGTGGGSTPYYNAGGYKYPADKDLKKLEIIPTTETREILGFSCKKYTYTYKKIFGEVWITDLVNLPNDLGVFRACKMAALHNTLSVTGFVMEMTTEDANGGKTLMKTVSLKNDEEYSIDFKGVQMNTAINKVNYFTF
jgi:GLPGLI family protein